MSFKERLERGFPVFKQMLSRRTPFIRQAIVSGGAAGNIAVAGIKAGDQLVSVIESADSSAAITDRTAQFVANTDDWIVREDGFINNAGGSSTANDDLLVTWIAWAE